MIAFLTLMMLGALFGMRHATDPDHVVAVTTIVTRERTLRSAVPLGAIWGLGHTLTIVIVGGAIVSLGWVVPPRVGLGMEFAVALMLIGLGVWSLMGRNQEGRSHVHAIADASRFRRLARPFVVGLVHGLAGSAAIALLVLSTIRDSEWALAYLLVFGIGTVGGMLLITAAVALPIAYTADRHSRIHASIGFLAAILSVGFGAFLVYRIGFADGLLTGHPQWTPG